ncbi:hypothetical protein PoB_000571900 [Plakobranchus ocellatus]|uniref:Uncharacterized protein n=1 Tax=Plakobranchus ocellatus TaxID=259542 RepID=A0AAV3Y8F7_9GAST|nr:hypothetical protein PoB_000571900 [Plakobranchus ocellatus]
MPVVRHNGVLDRTMCGEGRLRRQSMIVRGSKSFTSEGDQFCLKETVVANCTNNGEELDSGECVDTNHCIGILFRDYHNVDALFKHTLFWILDNVEEDSSADMMRKKTDESMRCDETHKEDMVKMYNDDEGHDTDSDVGNDKDDDDDDDDDNDNDKGHNTSHNGSQSAGVSATSVPEWTAETGAVTHTFQEESECWCQRHQCANGLWKVGQ